MMKKFSQFVWATGAAVVLAGGAYASSSSADKVAQAGETAMQEVQRVIYACKDNKQFQAVYINGEKNNYAVITQMDDVLPLEQVTSASGAVYQAMGDYNYELSTKGDTAFLTAGEQAVYEECKVANNVKLSK